MSQVDSANVSDMFFLFFYSKENVFMKDITSLALGCTFFYEALMPHKATLYHPIQIQHLNNAKNICTAAQVSCYHIKKSNGFAQQNNIKWDLQSICLLRCLKYLLPSEGIFKIFRLSLADFTFYRQIILKKKSDHFQQFQHENVFFHALMQLEVTKSQKNKFYSQFFRKMNKKASF